MPASDPFLKRRVGLKNVFWIGFAIGILILLPRTYTALLGIPFQESVGMAVQDLAALLLSGLFVGGLFILILLCCRLFGYLLRKVLS
jgi:hypothetical protein